MKREAAPSDSGSKIENVQDEKEVEEDEIEPEDDSSLPGQRTARKFCDTSDGM